MNENWDIESRRHAHELQDGTYTEEELELLANNGGSEEWNYADYPTL